LEGIKLYIMSSW